MGAGDALPSTGPPGHATYAFSGAPPELVASTSAFSAPLQNNFVRWLDWSPDGGWLATATDDNAVRLWRAPLAELVGSGEGKTAGLSLAATWPVGESFYGAAFHPLGGAPSPDDACPPAVPGFGAPLLAVAARAHPPRLVDAATGATLASYVPLNDVHEPAPALAVAFADGGARLLAAVGESVRFFDVARPGRDVAAISTRRPRRRSASAGDDGAELAGRIACVAAPADGDAPASAADPHLAAAGATRGGILLLDRRAPAPVALFGGHTGGVTQLAFGPGTGGATLFSAARRDSALHAWDCRALAGPLLTARRDARATNQRIAFGLDPVGGCLVSGGTGGAVSAFFVGGSGGDTTTPSPGDRVARWTAAGGGVTVAGLATHPWAPLVATGSGERAFCVGSESESEREEDVSLDSGLPRVCVAVWRPPYAWTDAESV